MSAEDLFGWTTLVLTIAMVAIAVPKQIIMNHDAGKAGITLLLVVLPLAVYISRIIYAWIIGSFYIVIPDIVGVLSNGVLLYQALVNPRIPIIDTARKRFRRA